MTLFQVVLLWLFVNCHYILTNGQLTDDNTQTNNDNDTVTKSNDDNKLSIWLNLGIVIILVILFVHSIRYSPSCRRRRKKLPHQIRKEKQLKNTNNIDEKSIRKHFGNIQDTFNINMNAYNYDQDEYINIENDNHTTSNTNSNSNSNSGDSGTDMSLDVSDIIEDDNNINILTNVQLLTNNINHYVENEYKDNYQYLISDMLGINQQHLQTNNNGTDNSEYEPL